MVRSLVSLCAREVVRDHGSSPVWLSCVPRELYRPLLEAAFDHCRPLAIGELVQRWPERVLAVGGRRKPDQCPPNRLCIQALLLAVVRGLTDKRCCLQVLDLCDLHTEDGRLEESIGGWSLTVALCSMLLQARAATSRGQRRDWERERKRWRESEREGDGVVKRDRGTEREKHEAEGEKKACGGEAYCQREPGGLTPQDVMVRGVRRRMELERRSEGQQQNCDPDWQQAAVVRVRADLFINARSWERVRGALSLPGPLRLHCRYLRVEELPAASIGALLALLPRQGLLGLDVRYSSLGVAGLALLLPLLAPFPLLHTLRLHYCNLDLQRSQPGQQEVLQDMSQGLALLTRLCRLSLTALRLPGHLRLLLSSLSQPLEVLELPYLSLTPADLAYLSSSQHASSLRELDLSENRLDESSLPSLQRLLAQGEGRLTQLSLCGCSLSDGLLGALLPSLSRCRVLKSLRLALNPLSRAGVVRLACAAAGIPTLQLLLYPTPLEEYEPGLSPTPSSAQLLDWPLVEGSEVRELTLMQLQEVLRLKDRSDDLLLTSDLLKYSTDLAVEDY
ncbi:leucine-rich repeat-containing protein 14 [Electrophorus electricus]|uniref:leucine-rich repeat-containing protein 14 n=1 Tax=Electrophorus electricus TaxID=8005 RepID=UPI0015D00781|nr:leucine-rich repeat-containing protein 14 [Electrophorus electricus]XP_035375748.1 leucine-rich repeat-containing protein 14 [Electrophorus electricus]XP_035375749.1 leucine-rich repeat-containing protein 14 [Electrophorus electricus]